MSNPSLTNFWLRNRDRSDTQMVNSDTSVTTTKVESQPAIVPTQSNVTETSQQASSVSFNANINDISFDSQLLPASEAPTMPPQNPQTYSGGATQSPKFPEEKKSNCSLAQLCLYCSLPMYHVIFTTVGCLRTRNLGTPYSQQKYLTQKYKSFEQAN